MSTKHYTITYEEIREISNEMIRLQNKLLQFGFTRTAQMMHETDKQLGWEVSDILSGTHPVTSLDENKKEIE